MSRFIVIEGLDGSGKTTISKRLVEYLRERGYRAHYTYEPSDSPFAEAFRRIKDLIETNSVIDALAMALDRAYHLSQEIEPLLREGYVVVSDRYYYSTIAYQGAMGLDIDWLVSLNKYFRRPDLAIYLDVSIETSLRRISGKKSAWPEYEKRDILSRAREIYLSLVERGELVRIDAERGLEEVFRDVVSLTDHLLKT